MGNPAVELDSFHWNQILGWARDSIRRYAALKPEDRGDAANRALERVNRLYPEFDPGGPLTFERWVRMHARYAARDVYRMRKRDMTVSAAAFLHSIPAPSTFDPEVIARNRELGRAIVHCLSALTATLRRRVMAAAHAKGTGVTQDVLAKGEKVTLDTFRKSLGDAREALRRCLERRAVSVPARLSVPPFSPSDGGREGGGSR